MSSPRRSSAAADPERLSTTPTQATKPKKSSGLRRTRQKARVNKKSGDVRSRPDARADGSTKRAHVDGPISGRGLRYLRGLGHHLEPIVQIGKEGITDALVAALRAALGTHELVKVRVGSEAPIDRKAAGPELSSRTGATLAQTLGRTLLLYKRHPNKPKIEIPR